MIGKERMRLEIATVVYPKAIENSMSLLRSGQSADGCKSMQQLAAQLAVSYADALIDELEKQKPVEWRDEDLLMLDETLHFIDEFQKSNRCFSENEMQNSVSCRNWLKSLKERMT